MGKSCSHRLGGLSLCSGDFYLCLAVGRYQIWPFSMLQALHTVALSHLKYGEFVPDNRRHVAAPDAPRVRFAIHASELRAGGHYVFLGLGRQPPLLCRLALRRRRYSPAHLGRRLRYARPDRAVERLGRAACLSRPGRRLDRRRVRSGGRHG